MRLLTSTEEARGFGGLDYEVVPRARVFVVWTQGNLVGWEAACCDLCVCVCVCAGDKRARQGRWTTNQRIKVVGYFAIGQGLQRP